MNSTNNLTDKQKELINLLKETLPTAPAKVAQANIDWYKPWEYGEAVSVGDRRSYEEVLYEVHNAAGDNLYPPSEVPAVWRRVWLEEWPEWVQPAGAHDAYVKDSKVAHNGKHWISSIDANVWEPGVYGWTEMEE